MIAIRMYAQSRTLLWHELKFYLNVDFSVQGIHTFLVDGRTPSLRIDITATVVVCDVHARRQQRELKLIVLDACTVPVQQHASNSGSASTWAKIQNIASNLWELVNEFHYQSHWLLTRIQCHVNFGFSCDLLQPTWCWKRIHIRPGFLWQNVEKTLQSIFIAFVFIHKETNDNEFTVTT